MKAQLLAVPLLALTAACSPSPSPGAAGVNVAVANNSQRLANREAPIPSQCYTKTDGVANPCWTCHTAKNGRNLKDDHGLQEQYAFSPEGLTNHWSNLQVDRRPAMARIRDDEVLSYIRQDNYRPLMQAMAGLGNAASYQPDLDYSQGFDARGFANDGSGWRAFVYKPFLGTFWPTNGATDDLLIRLPPAFRSDASGAPSQTVYAANLAILEAAMTVADTVPSAELRRAVERLDERAIGMDLDGNGKLTGTRSIRGLPTHYVGAARAEPVRRWDYPLRTEFLHSVRYIDPDAPNLLSARLKELRYSIKQLRYDDDSLRLAYDELADEKAIGKLPYFRGSAQTGLLNNFGWQYKGWIEAPDGQLRLQSHEEHYACMGCHGGIGVTADSSFGFPRKRPGAAGWGWQTLKGMPDAPQAGHAQGEIMTYLERVGGGDEFRANEELLARYFDEGQLNKAKVHTAPDVAALLTPSRPRALALNKAYWALVRMGNFKDGRDTLLAPAENVLKKVENGDTELRASGRVYADGRIWLDWPK